MLSIGWQYFNALQKKVFIEERINNSEIAEKINITKAFEQGNIYLANGEYENALGEFKYAQLRERFNEDVLWGAAQCVYVLCQTENKYCKYVDEYFEYLSNHHKEYKDKIRDLVRDDIATYK